MGTQTYINKKEIEKEKIIFSILQDINQEFDNFINTNNVYYFELEKEYGSLSYFQDNGFVEELRNQWYEFNLDYIFFQFRLNERIKPIKLKFKHKSFKEFLECSLNIIRENEKNNEPIEKGNGIELYNHYVNKKKRIEVYNSNVKLRKSNTNLKKKLGIKNKTFEPFKKYYDENRIIGTTEKIYAQFQKDKDIIERFPFIKKYKFEQFRKNFYAQGYTLKH